VCAISKTFSSTDSWSGLYNVTGQQVGSSKIVSTMRTVLSSERASTRIGTRVDGKAPIEPLEMTSLASPSSPFRAASSPTPSGSFRLPVVAEASEEAVAVAVAVATAAAADEGLVVGAVVACVDISQSCLCCGFLFSTV